MEMELKHGNVPKHDPVPLATLLAYTTSHLGVIPTMSTSFYPPWLLARLTATVDHIAEGRFGWNIVTSAENQAAQNFGMDQLYEHDLRYEMADEYVDLVIKLWESWDPDAMVRDAETGTYVDHTKVRTIDFEGRFYKSRGPLNTAPPPQGRPVLCQAGTSPRGRAFAAKYADTVIATSQPLSLMKEYRDDMRERVRQAGRKPDDCKILFLISPIVADTEQEAMDKRDRWMSGPAYIETRLASMSSITEIDFSKFDLDEPVPQLTTNGERGALESFLGTDRSKTLRELLTRRNAKEQAPNDPKPLIGTPDQVADAMAEMMDEVGGDGFLITCPFKRINRRYIVEITDGLVPALQRRNLTRTSYTFEHFRDNLLEF